jgi:glutamyl-tRNA synthetase/glutamyl-Q tRNA(Asp) synthetase
MTKPRIHKKFQEVIAKIRDFSELQGRQPISRFAPSPTGYLHHGHIASAIFVYLVTRAAQGKIVLRIEDHDQTRCKKEFEQEILADLAWLGFEHDAGVTTTSQPSPYRQSDRLTRYAQVTQLLQSRFHLYHCDCSRKKILAEHADALVAGEELRYPGHCRVQRKTSRDNGLRLQIDDTVVTFSDLWLGEQRQCPAQQCGDLLIRDRHGNYTYQFAVTIDDFDQNINLVIRGQDLVSSTGRQILLARMLARKDVPLFLHHPLIMEQQDRKLSKRHGSYGIFNERLKGTPPEKLIGQIAYQIGLIDQERACTLEDLLRQINS